MFTKNSYESSHILRDTDHRRIEIIRHKTSGNRYILRKYTGSGSAYAKLSKIRCPHIPVVYEVAQKGDQVLVLEEYIVGDTLQSLLSSGPPEPRQVRDISSQLCDALWVLHKPELVHRDIKPENVMLRGRDTILIDFDASRLYNKKKMVILSAPERDTQKFPAAVAAASVHYYPSDYTVPLTWTIQMKNGDKIILHQDLELVIQETVQISYQDHEMETAEQLNELLDSLADLYPKDLLEITLPAVTYSEPVTIKSRGCTLYGSEEDDRRTTFTNTLEVFTRIVQITDVNNIYFSGNGGTGLPAHEGVFIRGCHFNGWDTAVYGQDGSRPMIFDSVFSKNTIGFLFDNSTHATCSSDSYTGNVFEDNETAVLLENIPGSGKLDFSDNEFKNNVTDVTNNSTYSIVK